MDSIKRPIEERGKRNVYCPHYRTCLDHAVNQSWDVWRCGECENMSLKEPRDEVFYTHGGTVAYYSLSSEVI